MNESIVNVLLIDDDEDDFVITRRLLSQSKRTKYSLARVEDYDKAIDLISSASFDVYLLDYRLGEHNGLELLEEVQQKGVREPVILLTGQGDDEVDREALRAGAADYLVKACIDAETLDRSIRYALQKKEMLEKVVASSKLSLLGEISASIAHEINNPLAAVLGHAEILTKLVAREPIDRTMMAKSSETIVALSRRIGKIVGSLRSFSRDSARDPFQKVSVLTVVDETLDLCRERFRVYGVELHEPTIDPGLLVACRPSEIGQVILNLLSNAFDAAESADERWVKLDLVEQRDQVLIQVTDSGPGIPAEIQDKIMKSFFSTKESGKGTGLGLSISKRIIDGHNGKLELDRSHPNTRFVITLPKCRSMKASA